jgi:site-specific recombinase XerD
MSAVTRVFPTEFRERLVRLALDGISSPSTLRAYSAAIDEFLTWAPYQPVPEFSKALVQQYKSMLIEKRLAPSTINQRLAAVRRLTTEAADNGLLDPAVAAAITRVHGLKCSGVRLGNWLDEQHASALLITPAGDSLRGKRDRAVLTLLFGAGMRRSEVAGVVVEKLRIIEERWVIADLTGKGRRIRSVPVPAWAMAALKDWLDTASITAGPIFRPIDKTGRVGNRALGAQTIYNIVRQHVPLVDAAVRPHDLRRSFARLAYENHAAIEQLSITLGHASISTTERYIGARQNFRLAPCDLVMPSAAKQPPTAQVQGDAVQTEPPETERTSGEIFPHL